MYTSPTPIYRRSSPAGQPKPDAAPTSPARTREILNSRCDDLRSGRVKPVERAPPDAARRMSASSI